MSQPLTIALHAVGMLAGAVILHYALSAIDRMTAETRHGVRVAFLLLALGGFAQIVEPWLSSDVSAYADVMLAAGLALLMIFDRRCVVCPRAMAIGELRRRRDERPPHGEPV